MTRESAPGTLRGDQGSLGRPFFFDYTASVRTRFHRFLLMLLTLALPLQAFASASMLDCTFSHQSAMQAVALADGMTAGCHEPEQPDTSPAGHDCKHCAACALASALPIPNAGVPAAVQIVTRFISAPAVWFSGFIPDGPERPPRPSLA